MSAKKKKKQVIQIYDDRWYHLDDRLHEICCDCGLVHDTQYKMENGRIWWNTRRNEGMTKEQRKEFGITVKRKKQNPA